jgi:DNA-binding transcriptional ArsR family regulator
MVNHIDGQLDAAFGALAHPIRRGIVARLAGGDATVAELARPYRVSAPAISKHLHILEEAGLMSRRRDGRVHRCRLVPTRMQEAERWLEHHRRFWEQSLDRLEAYLQQVQKKERRHG